MKNRILKAAEIWIYFGYFKKGWPFFNKLDHGREVGGLSSRSTEFTLNLRKYIFFNIQYCVRICHPDRTLPYRYFFSGSEPFNFVPVCRTVILSPLSIFFPKARFQPLEALIITVFDSKAWTVCLNINTVFHYLFNGKL